MFSIQFNEETQQFEILNGDTGTVASIPDPRKLWITAEASPDMLFFEQNGVLIYTSGGYFDRKQIGLWDKANNWVCILNVKNDLVWLKDMKAEKGTKTFHLSGCEFPVAHNFAHNRIYTETIHFNFYDLATNRQAALGVTMLREPDKDWHIQPLEEFDEGCQIWERLERRLLQWQVDFEKLGAASLKHKETEIRACTGIGRYKMFKCPANQDGNLFELWDTDFEKGWSDRFEHYHEAALLDKKESFFFRKRADVDAPLYSKNGIEIYQTPDGLQIEDITRGEKFYYIPSADFLVRASWDWESLPIQCLHNQLQVFDVLHPGHMPRVKLNHGGGCDRHVPVDLKQLMRALIENDLQTIANVLSVRNHDYTGMPNHQKEEGQAIWGPFPEPTENWWYSEIHRTLKNYVPNLFPDFNLPAGNPTRRLSTKPPAP